MSSGIDWANVLLSNQLLDPSLQSSIEGNRPYIIGHIMAYLKSHFTKQMKIQVSHQSAYPPPLPGPEQFTKTRASMMKM